MTLVLELNCLVLSDDPSHCFAIEILNIKKISDLKELIKDKKKPVFDHVPADSLDVYKVSFPVDHVLDTTLKCFQPAHDPENGVHHLLVPVK